MDLEERELKLLEELKIRTLSVLNRAGLGWLPQHVIHSTYGIKQLRSHISNKKKEWSASDDIVNKEIEGSASDSYAAYTTDKYLTACNFALTTDEGFSRFKSEKHYKKVLEHTGYKFGRGYLSVLSDRGFQIPLNFIRIQSKIGDPEIFEYPKLGEISPSTLRYLKVVSDLDFLFPGWKSQNIIEVGVGYGGQFCAFRELGYKGNYLGIDFEVVAKLALKYASATDPENGASFLGFDSALPISMDHVFLSNFAFSEFDPETQEFYLEKYIRNSSRGYLMWNQLSELYRGGMTAESLRKIVSGRILDEEPLTHPGNCLVVWG